MLPFLKKDKTASVIMSHRKPGGMGMGAGEPAIDESDLHSVVEELFKAFEAKDVAAGVKAIKAAFEICDAMPHVEGEHLSE